MVQRGTTVLESNREIAYKLRTEYGKVHIASFSYGKKTEKTYHDCKEIKLLYGESCFVSAKNTSDKAFTTFEQARTAGLAYLAAEGDKAVRLAAQMRSVYENLFTAEEVVQG